MSGWAKSLIWEGALIFKLTSDAYLRGCLFNDLQLFLLSLRYIAFLSYILYFILRSSWFFSHYWFIRVISPSVCCFWKVLLLCTNIVKMDVIPIYIAQLWNYTLNFTLASHTSLFFCYVGTGCYILLILDLSWFYVIACVQ